jgi:hypothetical protein
VWLRSSQTVLPSTNRVYADRAIFLWGTLIYVFLSAIYIFPSGVPQPADLLFASLCGAALLLNRGTLLASKTPGLWPLYGFLLYCIAVNVVWTIALSEPKGLLPPLYYAFNVVVFLVAAQILARPAPLGTLRLALAVSLCIQVTLSFFVPMRESDEYMYVRQIILFNNPNQLAYWGLLCCSIVLSTAAQRTQRFSIGTLETVSIAATSWLMALSLSKAALIAFGVLLLIYFTVALRSLLKASCIAVAALLLVDGPLSGFSGVTKITARMAGVGLDADDTLRERGYTRIVDYPQHLFLGAGEMDHSRFGSHRELHSSPGTILFAYGLPGLMLFAAFVLERAYAARRPFLYLAYLMPAFIYGLTHMGLRDSMLWILLGVATALPLVPTPRRRAS